MLYLENALASHVFTPDRARLLELLAAQAAISLENTRLYGDLQEREAKIRRLVDSNIIGHIHLEFRRSNHRGQRSVSRRSWDMAAMIRLGPLRWTDLTPPEWSEPTSRPGRAEDDRNLQPYEKEFFRKDGSRVPVLVARRAFGERRDQGVAFVLDLTERKRAEAERAKASGDTAKSKWSWRTRTASRPWGNCRPRSPMRSTSRSRRRSPTRRRPCAGWTPSRRIWKGPAGDRSHHRRRQSGREVIGGIRSLVKKEPPRQDRLEINETIMEVDRADPRRGVEERAFLCERNSRRACRAFEEIGSNCNK